MFHRIGAAAYKADLNNTILLCRLLGNPHQSFTSIHVAGTNGKGSVSHLLASILQESGLKAGLYTSPHLVDFRERIRINGQMIPREKITLFINKYKEAFGTIGLSFFEMTVGLAFDHFREEKVDIAVLETGLGGRLDSTNVVTPVLSVITNIGHDHQAFLGDTLEKIAAEKAGIIKEKVPVVIGETQNETSGVFLRISGEHRAPIVFADQHFSLMTSPGNPSGNILDGFNVFHDGMQCSTNLVSPLKGYYQVRNIATVFQSVELLNELGFHIPEHCIANGIRKVFGNTGLMGRWQVLGQKPLTICDVGHNPEGIRYNVNQLSALAPERLHIVFGMVADKEIQQVLSLLPGDAFYYFCKADIPRALDEHQLCREAQRAGLRGKAYSSVRKALASARRKARPNHVIFIGGSTFVVAEVLSHR